MASLLQIISILLLPLLHNSNCMAIKPNLQPYIVYMGSSLNAKESNEISYLQLLSSISSRENEENERASVLNYYNHAFKGFSALLTEKEASILSDHNEIVSVFPDPILELHTTRSWDFLEAEDSKYSSYYHQNTSDVIIGIIDTGIWPESPSFSDDGFGKIPSKWKGVCMESSDLNKSNCNRKLIGARFYSQQVGSTARDSVGHGTHTASTAGGVLVRDANYYGLAEGTARGGLPSARIASYKACSSEGCMGSVLLKAIDDAIKDGVDIISISIGMSSIFQSDFLKDPIAIGAFHAEQMGVAVVCSGGNDGPEPYTVVNSAPWIFTVGASTLDRDFQSTIMLGNNETYKGVAINFSPITLGKMYPLASGEEVAAIFTSASDARNCIPGSIDSKKAAGKIIVCMNDDASVSRRIKKLVVEDAKAVGVIIIDGQQLGSSSPFDSGTYPFAQVEQNTGEQILQYINSTKNPTANILATKTIENFKPAPVVASFSSRGPGVLTENILKPDIMAPGVAILAAIVPRIVSDYSAPGNKSSLYGIRSGTSMACPHVTGAMAFIKFVHPQWSSSIIKSALITTASASDNMGKPFSNSSNHILNPHESGAGEIRPIKALDPGLVFKTTTNDHLLFLCYHGFTQENIRLISNMNFTCPRNSTEQLISNINYPTISIGRISKHEGLKMVKRVVTNVGSLQNTTYVCSVNGPPGLVVKVAPTRIIFSEERRRASFRVLFDGKNALKGYNFGDVIWFDGSHVVRVVFAVNVV